MGGVFLYILIALSSVSNSATADTTNIFICADSWGCPYSDPNLLSIWDDRVFNVGGASRARGGRPHGDELGYNSEQRATWIRKCRPKLRIDFHAFQRCFRDEQEKAAAEVQRQFDDVQRRRHPSTR